MDVEHTTIVTTWLKDIQSVRTVKGNRWTDGQGWADRYLHGDVR